MAHSVEEAGGALATFSVLASLAAAARRHRSRVGPLQAAEREARRDPPPLPVGRAARSSTSSTSTRPTTSRSTSPRPALATWLGRWVEEPFVLRSLGGLGTGVRDVSDRVSAVQTGRVRAYVLALAMGLAVLAIVFLVAS